MYLVSEAIRLMLKSGTPKLSDADIAVLKNYKVNHIDKATRFIPLWVKVAVALALGLGTMVGWKRIVVTVGEKIGKNHLTYAQGAAAEITAMVTIGAADMYGLPVSGRESFGNTDVHGSQFSAGVGAYAAGGDDAVGLLVLDVHKDILGVQWRSISGKLGSTVFRAPFFYAKRVRSVK